MKAHGIIYGGKHWIILHLIKVHIRNGTSVIIGQLNTPLARGVAGSAYLLFLSWPFFLNITMFEEEAWRLLFDLISHFKVTHFFIQNSTWARCKSNTRHYGILPRAAWGKYSFSVYACFYGWLLWRCTGAGGRKPPRNIRKIFRSKLNYSFTILLLTATKENRWIWSIYRKFTNNLFSSW